MVVKRLRGFVPRSPVVRVVLLLAVAGVAIGVAGALLSGRETAATDPPTQAAAPPADTAAPSQPAVTGDNAAAPTTPTVGTPTATSPADSPTADAGTATTAANTGNVEPATSNAPAGDTPPADASAASPADTAAPSQPAVTGGDDAPAATTPADGAPTAASPADGPTADAATATAATSTTAASTTTASAPPETTVQLIEQLRPLIAEQDRGLPAYDRDHFAGWIDSDEDCVDTRHEILQAEAASFSMNAEGCAVASGEWFDLYTNRTFTDPRDLDVDHVVALADAWVSGAWAWADELLDRFANDFGNLNAIAAGENRSKSARGPAGYSPSAPAAACDYLVQYATVKIRWGLSITPQDFEVVATGLAGCDVGGLPDTPPPASTASGASAAPPTTTATASANDCHPAYDPCLANLPGDALNCGDLRSDQRPVTVVRPGVDPYRLDRDGDGRGCTG